MFGSFGMKDLGLENEGEESPAGGAELSLDALMDEEDQEVPPLPWPGLPGFLERLCGEAAKDLLPPWCGPVDVMLLGLDRGRGEGPAVLPPDGAYLDFGLAPLPGRGVLALDRRSLGVLAECVLQVLPSAAPRPDAPPPVTAIARKALENLLRALDRTTRAACGAEAAAGEFRTDPRQVPAAVLAQSFAVAELEVAAGHFYSSPRLFLPEDMALALGRAAESAEPGGSPTPAE